MRLITFLAMVFSLSSSILIAPCFGQETAALIAQAPQYDPTLNRMCITLLNASNKKIAGFRLWLVDNRYKTRETSLRGTEINSFTWYPPHFLNPGATKTHCIPMRAPDKTTVEEKLSNTSVEIAGVVFSDESFQGEQENIRNLREKLQGARHESKRLFSLLHEFRESHKPNFTCEAFEGLETSLANLPSENVEGSGKEYSETRKHLLSETIREAKAWVDPA